MKTFRILIVAALVAAFVPHAALGAVLPDAFEDDDSRVQARAVGSSNLPLVEARTIDATGTPPDWDVYRVNGSSGTLYTFETTGPADTLLEVWNAGTTEMLGWYDDKSATEFGAKGYWRATGASPVAHAFVGPANSDTGGGAYTMSITAKPGATRDGRAIRKYGSSRESAAANLAKSVYSDAAGSPWHYYVGSSKRNVSHVFVTSGNSEAYVSPMIVQPLAAIYNAPVLLVGEKTLPSATKSAIDAIRKNNGGAVKIHVVGSTGWVASSVYNKLKALKGPQGSIERIAAADSYELAAKIADRVDTAWVRDVGTHASTVIVANGSSKDALTDLLVASGLAYQNGWPILLTKIESVPSPTYVRVATGNFKRSRVLVANSTKYVKPATYTKAMGDERLSTHSDRASSALDIARKGISHHWLTHDDVVVVNKVSEALTVGSYAGARGSPILVSGTRGPGTVTRGYFLARPSMVDFVSVVGSTASLSNGGVVAYGNLLH